MHMAVDTASYLLSLHVTPANERERAQASALAREVQDVMGQSVELTYVDQGYTGEEVAEAAAEHGIQPEAVKHTEARRGFVLLPRRRVVERSFAWGRLASADWQRTTSDFPRPWPGCTSSPPSPSSYSLALLCLCSQVHDAL